MSWRFISGASLGRAAGGLAPEPTLPASPRCPLPHAPAVCSVPASKLQGHVSCQEVLFSAQVFYGGGLRGDGSKVMESEQGAERCWSGEPVASRFHPLLTHLDVHCR